MHGLGAYTEAEDPTKLVSRDDMRAILGSNRVIMPGSWRDFIQGTVATGAHAHLLDNASFLDSKKPALELIPLLMKIVRGPEDAKRFTDVMATPLLDLGVAARAPLLLEGAELVAAQVLTPLADINPGRDMVDNLPRLKRLSEYLLGRPHFPSHSPMTPARVDPF